jgi:hypothetical protein
MKTHTLFSVIAVATIFHASVHAQQIPSAASHSNTKDLTPSAESRTMIERGLKGSKDRPEPKAFSGQPLFPAVPFGQAVEGGPNDKAKSTAQGSTASIVMKSTRFAAFETAAVKSSGTGSLKATAAAAPASKSSPENAVVYDDPRAQMVIPVDGSVLYPTQTFVWTAGYQVSEYFLYIGSCSGCNDLLYENEGQNLSRTVSLPVDGRLIYVTLFSSINGTWYWIEYQYQAPNGGSPFPAQMTSPASGSTLASEQTFSWSPGYEVGAFFLQIGSCQGCDDLLNENEGQNLWRTVGLPVDGRTIFARLFSLIGGTWHYFDYEYRASLTQTTTQLVRVNIVNQLALPVNIAINGQVVGSCPALTTAGINVNVSQLTVSFQVIQPTLNGQSLGDQMGGVFSQITNPSGTFNFVVSNKIGSNYYFEPLITNQTPVPLDIEVNGGLQAQNRCNCSAPAGDTNVATGYYLFYSNSNVRLYFNGSNYTGPYLYFGIDNGSGVPLTNYVTGTAAQVQLVATREP